ncbi:MAG: exodeoxyribonuclease VII large subunit, partial [Mixta calida]|nr:exodeoxyribonuclease VII large subunit [Mixta calida]
PQLRLARQQTALFRLQRRLDEALQLRLREAARQQDRLTQRLAAQQPQRNINRAQQQLQQWQYRLTQAMRQRLSEEKQRFGALAGHLEGVSPLATLARGFSVTQTPTGEVLKTAGQLQPGDKLQTRLQDGWVESEVKTITPLKKTRKKRT